MTQVEEMIPANGTQEVQGDAPLTVIQTLYDNYLTDYQNAREENKKKGFFGLGFRMKKDPVHDTFLLNLEKEVQRILVEDISREEAEKIVDYMLHAHQRVKERDTVYWIYLAAHALAKDFIPRISHEKAQEMIAFYNAELPRSKRFPVHKEILKLLEAQ